MPGHFRLMNGSEAFQYLTVGANLDQVPADAINEVAQRFGSVATLALEQKVPGGIYRELSIIPPIPDDQTTAFGEQLQTLDPDARFADDTQRDFVDGAGESLPDINSVEAVA